MKTSKDIVWIEEKDNSFIVANTIAATRHAAFVAAARKHAVRAVQVILVSFAAIWFCRLLDLKSANQVELSRGGQALGEPSRGEPSRGEKAFCELLGAVWVIAIVVVFFITVIDCLDRGSEANLRRFILTILGPPAVMAVIVVVILVVIMVIGLVTMLSTVVAVELWIVASVALVTAIAIAISYLTNRPSAMEKFLVVMLHPLYDPDIKGPPGYD